MIKNIVFDIGNVLLDFNPLAYLNDLFIEEKISEQLQEQIFKSPEWLLLDRGTITREETLEVLSLRHPVNADKIEKSLAGWMEILTPKEESIQLVNKLYALDYKLLLLSNFHKDAFEFITDKYEFFKMFQGGIISYKENLIKPEAEIYEKLLKKYELAASETIFIDDTFENVAAAKKAGINAILFKDCEQLKADLKVHNIKVD